jgi:hypothetical protein
MQLAIERRKHSSIESGGKTNKNKRNKNKTNKKTHSLHEAMEARSSLSRENGKSM